MKYIIRIWEGDNLVQQKGPYLSEIQAKIALSNATCRLWVPHKFKTEIIEWPKG